MPRYFSIGLLIAILVGVVGAVSYVYKTDSTKTIAKFGNVSLRIEYALTEAQREQGLGGRETLPNDYGMLFVFPRDGYYGFWMKDTLVPLDMFWLDDQGQVIWMEQSVATTTYPAVFYPQSPARYVLETTAGFAQLHSIATGTSLIIHN